MTSKVDASAHGPAGAARYDDIDFKPPQGVQDEAALGLEWREEYGRGGTAVGVARARDLSNGKNISPDTARRMNSFFARHADNRTAKGWKPGEEGYPSAGRIAWALWGGDPGKTWAAKLARQMDNRDAEMKAEARMQKLRIDGPIGTGQGEFSAAMMAEFLQAAGGDAVEVTIHSEGGSVYEGMAIHDAIQRYEGPTRALIQSMAFSIASFIPLAFDEVEISPNGWLMLHNPYTEAIGDDAELTARAEQVRGIKDKMIAGYAERMGQEPAVVQAIMAKETYIDAREAVDLGLVDRIAGGVVKSERGINGMARLPRSVVRALFGSETQPSKELPVTVDQKQVASARAIKQALPQARAEFVVRCMEKEMSMEEVKDEYMEEMVEQLAAMEQEKAQLLEEKAAMTEEVEALRAKVTAMEEEENESVSMRARYRSGVRPLPATPKAAQSGDPVAEWNALIEQHTSRGLSKMKAVQLAAKSHPHVRAAMVTAANVR